MKTSNSIDLFIAEFPKEMQALLQKVRETIRKAAPKAEESINYGIPTFKLEGNLVHFSGYKQHIGFYPGSSGIKAFEKELSIYKGAKGSVQFPLDKPIPYALITKITKFRVKENLEKAEAKKKPKSKIDFFESLSAPARRALENNGITTLKKLSSFSEEAIMGFHGMGKSSIPILNTALKAGKLGFKKKDSKVTTEKNSDSEQVTAHIKKLEPGLGKIVETIRQIILSTDKNISERIKWNNPSFYYTGEMKPFDPKEYKREITVFNLFKGRIMLVFPSGAKVKDTSGLLEGEYKDGRRITVFKDMKDVKEKEKALRSVLKKWLQLVDK